MNTKDMIHYIVYRDIKIVINNLDAKILHVKVFIECPPSLIAKFFEFVCTINLTVRLQDMLPPKTLAQRLYSLVVAA